MDVNEFRYSVRFVRDGYIRFRYAVDAEMKLVFIVLEPFRELATDR